MMALAIMQRCFSLATLLVAPAVISAAGPYDPAIGFPIGILAPFWGHEHLAVSIAFDLDFRKNLEPALAERLGPPMINISNIHPLLNVSVQIGNTAGQPPIGLRTALDWFQGTGGYDRVVGLVAAALSTVTIPIASNGAVFEVPQLGWASTSPDLSDKNRYPFFCRTVPPDNLAGSAMWAWKEHFEVPSLAVMFSLEDFGTGMYESVREKAVSADKLDQVVAIGYDSSGSYPELEDACQRLEASGRRFVIIVGFAFTSVMYTLEQQGMLYSGTHQLLGTDSRLSTSVPAPSKGWPVGYQRQVTASRGPRWEAFKRHWSRMTPEDIYGEDARRRYKLDLMYAPLQYSEAYNLTNETFTLERFESSFSAYSPRIMDAAYSIVLGINALLHKGFAPDEIYGEALLHEIHSLSFEGLAGFVSFDQNCDINANYELINSIAGGQDEQKVATVNPNTGMVTLGNPDDKLLWMSGTYSAKAPADLMTCKPGEQWSAFTGVCIPCPTGFISAGGPLAKCSACAVGSTSNAEATNCTECALGWFSALPGASCSACPPGTFAGSLGVSACADCGVGTFSENPAMSACSRCGHGLSSQERFTTMTSLVVGGTTEYLYAQGATSESLCGCSPGSRNISSGDCILCEEGLYCKGMGSVLVKEGYFAEADLSVFRCYGGTKRCRGGPPGVETVCAEGRKSLICAECERGMTPGSEGTCKDCGDGDVVPFVCLTALAFVGLVLTYHFIDTHNRATQSHALLLCSFAVAQLITVSQQISIIGMLNLDWKDPIKSFFSTIGLLAFNLDVLRLNCLGNVRPFSKYVMKVLAVFVGILTVVLIHCVFVLLRYKGRFIERLPVLIGIIGTIFMVLYISVTSAVLEPLQCLSHPNDRWTIRAYPTILCWESRQHTEMLILGCVVFVLVPVGFLTCAAVIVREFPKRLRKGDSQSVRAFYFLFFRFKPQCHTYVLFHLFKSFLMAFVLVVPHIVAQMFLLNAILLAGFAVTMSWLPWRVPQANVLDAVFACMTMMLIMFGVAFIQEEDRNLEGLAEACFAIVLVGLGLVPVFMMYGAWKRFFRFRKPFQYFLCHHKVGSGAWTRLLKFHLLDTGKIKSQVFIDSDNLDHLDHLFDYVGNDTGTLLVIGTRDIFRRPWCIGEICTARVKGVKTVVLALPTYEVPDDSCIADLESRVTNLEILIESGMTVEMLQATLHWVETVPKVIVPAEITIPIMDAIVLKLFSKLPHSTTRVEVASSSSVKGFGSSEGNTESVVLCDLEDTEALATSMILHRMLMPLLSNEYEWIPSVAYDDNLIRNASMTLVICTSLAFARANFLSRLLLVRHRNMRLLPVFADPAFQIPGKHFADHLQHINMGKEASSSIVIVVTALFKMIGAAFQPGHASETVLEVSATELAKHVKGNTKAWSGSASNLPSLPRTSTENSPRLEDKTCRSQHSLNSGDKKRVMGPAPSDDAKSSINLSDGERVLNSVLTDILVRAMDDDDETEILEI